ncbi:hypothetical protein GJ496_008961 [Pomphorhynchus laevis]|nr:hypothetical protein GJ496_008961 [Pomphorhynchus laevis]
MSYSIMTYTFGDVVNGNEWFHRGVTNYGTYLKNEDTNCWENGKYYDSHNKKCGDFSNLINANNIQQLNKYTRSEMEMICLQLWLQYDREYQFCVDRGERYQWINISAYTFFAESDALNNTSKFNKCPSQMATFSQNDQQHVIACLIKNGLTYNPETKKCCILDKNIDNILAIEKYRQVIGYNKTKEQIWRTVCSKLKMTYSVNLRHCIKESRELLYKNEKLVAHARVLLEALAGGISDYVTHLYCAARGLFYKESKCFYFDTSQFPSNYYFEFKSLIDQAKEIQCSAVNMLYKRHLDICIQIVSKSKHKFGSFPALYKLKVKRGQLPPPPKNTDKLPANDNRRFTYSKNELFCFKLGFNYVNYRDACEYFTDSLQVERKRLLLLKYLPYIHKIIKTNCHKRQLVYLKKYRICVEKGYLGKYNKPNRNKRTPGTEVINPLENGWYNIFSMCIKDGFDYDSVKEDCVQYPKTITASDLYLFDQHKTEQLIHACYLFYFDSSKSLINCISSQENQIRTKKSNVQKKIAKSRSDRLIEAACKIERNYYHPLVKVCMWNRDDKLYPVQIFDNNDSEQYRDRKISYDDAIEEFCANLGMPYNSTLDDCTPLLWNTRQKHIDRIKRSQMKIMCTLEFQDTEYDSEINMCVRKRKEYELLTPMVPDIDINQVQLGHDICFNTGMKFNEVTKSCEHYDIYHSESMKDAGSFNSKRIESFVKMLCTLRNLRYDPFYQFCVYDGIDYLGFSPARKPVNITQLYEFHKHDCFMRGLTVTRDEDDKIFCHAFPPGSSKNITIKNQYSINKFVWMTQLCPPYLQYNPDMGFFVRVGQKLAPIIELIDITYYNKTQFKQCCMQYGLFYNKLKRNCVHFAVRPTRAELRVYNNELHDLVEHQFSIFCGKINKRFNERKKICTDPF